ncbi:hypothetical protein L9G74_10905 [Shewanella sp. C32]|uniref:Uncharacterized protein n=1 Tax=Shewanella electrica TaxID=515560 RepID=A0ABT2FLV6_9GAMM|nr:hypothetical protein [Shewanella electrica]MCH1923733.1 hypothetical protein [Shewanella electrica]MCS4556952.1 hypothetical protein [Shewanella electrica]
MDVANAVKQAVKGSCGGVIGYWLYGFLNGFEDVNWYYSLALAAGIFVLLCGYYLVRAQGASKIRVAKE